MCISCSMTNKLNHFGSKYYVKGLTIKNEQNGYALLSFASPWILKIGIVFYSVGINKYNINKNNDTIHAEVDCIQKF